MYSLRSTSVFQYIKYDFTASRCVADIIGKPLLIPSLPIDTPCDQGSLHDDSKPALSSMPFKIYNALVPGLSYRKAGDVIYNDYRAVSIQSCNKLSGSTPRRETIAASNSLGAVWPPLREGRLSWRTR